MIDEANGFMDHAMLVLYTIEAAIINCRWQNVDDDRKAKGVC